MIKYILFFCVMALANIRRFTCMAFPRQCNCKTIRVPQYCVATTPQSFRLVPRLTSTRLHSSSDQSSKDDKSVKGRIKSLWTSYGPLGIGAYLGVYVTTLGSIFLALDYDLFHAAQVGLDPASAIEKVCNLIEGVTGSTAFPGYIKEHPRVGTFAIAWVMTKFTEPVRLGFTLLTLPSLARWVGTVQDQGKRNVTK